VQHSIIIRLCKRLVKLINQYYRFSSTRKMVNNISNTLRNIFVNSSIYKFFSSENYNIQKLLEDSVIGKFEGIFQKTIDLLSPLYRKGVQGSFVMQKADEVRMSKKGNAGILISFMIIGAVLSYNLLSIINRTVYVEQIYISVLIGFLAINLYFVDAANLYKNSFVKKIIDGIFRI